MQIPLNLLYHRWWIYLFQKKKKSKVHLKIISSCNFLSLASSFGICPFFVKGPNNVLSPLSENGNSISLETKFGNDHLLRSRSYWTSPLTDGKHFHEKKVWKKPSTISGALNNRIHLIFTFKLKSFVKSYRFLSWLNFGQLIKGEWLQFR